MDTPRQNVAALASNAFTAHVADSVIAGLEDCKIHPSVALTAIALALYRLSKAQTPNPGQEENAKEWTDALYEVAKNGEVK